MSQAKNIEGSIDRIKLDLSRISEKRWRAALSRNQGEVARARVMAAEKTLENVETLGRYVANYSAPLARQIAMREAAARSAFEEIRATTNPELFHRWIKNELIPSTRFAERLGHLAACASKSEQLPNRIHRWSVK